MKRFFLIFIILTSSACSLDNKTGIWKDASNTPIEKQQMETIDRDSSSSRFEDVYEKSQPYNEEKDVINSYLFNMDEFYKNKNWLEEYGDKTNNISNHSYSSQKILLSKSPRLSKSSSSNNILFYDNNLITQDHKGKIFVYSPSLRKKIFIYDFYKKKFKSIKKKIDLIVDRNILYAADNLGYLYAINLNTKSLIWAKNYGIPFRSNLKIINDQILLINQDNQLYSFNKSDGRKNWEFSTTSTFLKTDFKNNIVIDELNSYYLKFKNKSCDYIKKWPSKKNLSSWYVVLKHQGYQNSHIHPEGWLSGVIYLKVVPSLGKNEGAIEFSLNGVGYSDKNASKLVYQPKAGDIVFFPSSLNHRTIPFTTDTDRITVSFDLMPSVGRIEE